MRFRWFLAALVAPVVMVGGALGQTTVTFQQGVDGYTGTFDRLLNLNNNRSGSEVDATTTSFFIDGDPIDESRADYLIRFDNIIGGGAIPEGAIILSATLTLKTTTSEVNGNSQSGESYSLYRLTKPFDANSLFDGDFGDSDFAFTPYVDGVTSVIDSVRVEGVLPEQVDADWCLGTFDRPVGESQLAVDQFYSADMTRAVQSWVDGAPNLGIAVISDHIDNDDGWSVHPTGSSDVAARPMLTVTYIEDDSVQVIEAQQGMNGYNGTSDVFLFQTLPSIDGSTVSEAFLDGSDGGTSYDDPYMIRFELDELLPEQATVSEVLSAELIFKTGITSGASDSRSNGGVGFGVHQLLTPFTTSSQYTDFAGDYAAMEAAGQISSQVALFEDIDEAELVKVDVTGVVTNWLINGDTNHGFYIGAFGTSNGWQIFSSGALDSNMAPMLRMVVKTVVLGDANGDGFFDFGDIEPFVLALQDPDAFADQYPNVNPDVVLDFDGDGVFSFGDIEGFVNALLG